LRGKVPDFFAAFFKSGLFLHHPAQQFHQIRGAAWRPVANLINRSRPPLSISPIALQSTTRN
jgi:hypothetical protein